MGNFSSLKNILFDLGGVILDLDVNATLSGFYELGFPKEMLSYPENFNTDIFYRYETGKMGTAEFRNAIREATGIFFEDLAFDKAWNAMLLGVPPQRAELVKSLTSKYDLYVLSNTCELHIAIFEKMFRKVAGISVQDLFRRAYYSHEIGFHKPDPEAFKFVLADSGILAKETLFLDDNIHNVKAAQALGFNALHISEYLRLDEVGFDL